MEGLLDIEEMDCVLEPGSVLRNPGSVVFAGNAANTASIIAAVNAGLDAEAIDIGLLDIRGGLTTDLILADSAAPNPAAPEMGLVVLRGSAETYDIAIGKAQLTVVMIPSGVFGGGDITAGAILTEQIRNPKDPDNPDMIQGVTGVKVDSLTATAGDVDIAVIPKASAGVTVAEGIAANAVYNPDTGDKVSGGNVFMDAQDGDIEIGLDGIAADSEIRIVGAAIASGGDLLSGGDMSLTAVDSGFSRGVVAVEGDVVSGGVLAVTGDLVSLGALDGTVREVSGVDGVAIDAANAVEIEANVSSRSGAVSVTGTDIAIGANGADNNAAGDITANKGILVDSEGEIIIGGNVSNIADGSIAATGDIEIGAAGKTQTIMIGGNVNAEKGASASSGGNVDFRTSDTGSVEVFGDINADGAVTSTTAVTTTFHGAVNAGGGMAVREGAYGSDVTGDLTTSGNSVFAEGSSYSDGNLTNHGTLVNNTDGSETRRYGLNILDGKTFENNGVFENKGDIFFADGSAYQGGSGSSIDNAGVMYADIAMAKNPSGESAMKALIADTLLKADGTFIIGNFDDAPMDNHVLDYDIAFTDGQTAAGSRVTLYSPLTTDNVAMDIVGSRVYSSDADLNIAGGPDPFNATEVELIGSTLATSNRSVKGFTVEANSTLQVTNGGFDGADNSRINASRAIIESDAKAAINGNATLTYAGFAGRDSRITFEDATGMDGPSVLKLTAWDPTLGNAYSGKLGRLIVENADLVIGEGVILDIDVVDENGVERTWLAVGQEVAIVDGAISGVFDSSYHLYQYVNDDGANVLRTSFKLEDDRVYKLWNEDLFRDDTSKNKIHVSQYIDDIFEQAAGLNEGDANPNYLTSNIWAESLAWDIAELHRIYWEYPNGYEIAWKGYGQMGGEYGAYALNLLRDTHDAFLNTGNQNFWKMQNKRIGFGLGLARNAVSADGAYAVVRSDRGGYDVCRRNVSVWAEGYGYWGKQRNRSNVHGYDYDSGGFNLGFDYSVGNFDFSFFGGYTKGKLKVKEMSTKFDGDMMNLGLTAAYTHESGFYGRLGLAFGYGWNDYDMHYVLGGAYHGDYDSQAYTAGLELGYIARTSFANFIPSLGVIYTHYRHDSWNESGGAIAHNFDSENMNTVDIPVSLRINRVFTRGAMQLAPEVRAAWVYAAKRERARVNMGLLSDPFQGHTSVYGVDAGRSRFVVGGGLKARFGDRFDASVDYNFVGRRKYTSHNVTASFGVNF